MSRNNLKCFEQYLSCGDWSAVLDMSIILYDHCFHYPVQKVSRSSCKP